MPCTYAGHSICKLDDNVYVEGGRGKKGGIEIGGFAIFRFAVEKKTFTDLGVA